jgi:hypothetical protein
METIRHDDSCLMNVAHEDLARWLLSGDVDVLSKVSLFITELVDTIGYLIHKLAIQENPDCHELGPEVSERMKEILVAMAQDNINWENDELSGESPDSS